MVLKLYISKRKEIKIKGFSEVKALRTEKSGASRRLIKLRRELKLSWPQVDSRELSSCKTHAEEQGCLRAKYFQLEIKTSMQPEGQKTQNVLGFHCHRGFLGTWTRPMKNFCKARKNNTIMKFRENAGSENDLQYAL